MSAKSPSVSLSFFGVTPSKPMNGITKTPTKTARPTGSQAPQSRAKTNPVSSGMLPYQITRNWDHIR